jgi:hypothetical protein
MQVVDGVEENFVFEGRAPVEDAVACGWLDADPLVVER